MSTEASSSDNGAAIVGGLGCIGCLLVGTLMLLASGAAVVVALWKWALR